MDNRINIRLVMIYSNGGRQVASGENPVDGSSPAIHTTPSSDRHIAARVDAAVLVQQDF